MEYEVRFYFNTKKLDNLLKKLASEEKLLKEEKMYEKTIQYDHPSDELSFYTKEVDGRFRLRVSQSDLKEKCKLSWKRRLPNTTETEVNKEEEIELNIKYDEYNNLLFILDNVLKMKQIESYERYRTIFANNEIEIALDQYPFGVALEIENKANNGDPEEIVKKWVNELGLDLADAYRLSWDDKYQELCKAQGIEIFNHVLFGKPMPQVDE